MTHPGVGALTALAFGLIIGTPERFARSKELSSYLGLGADRRLQRRTPARVA